MPDREGGEARNHEAEQLAAEFQKVWPWGTVPDDEGWLALARLALDAGRRSPQREDHEAGLRFCNNCDSPVGTVRAVVKLRDCPECYEPIVPVEDHTHLSRCPSPDLAAWLRSDEAERVRIEAERDEIPPEDALAHAWEQLHGCPSPDRDTEKEN